MVGGRLRDAGYGLPVTDHRIPFPALYCFRWGGTIRANLEQEINAMSGDRNVSSTSPPPASASSSGREIAAGFGRALVVLKPHKATPFYARHPWVFASAVQRVEGDCGDGDVVDLVSEKRKFIARGIINRRSRLWVRLYTWNAGQALDDGFWRQGIRRDAILPVRHSGRAAIAFATSRYLHGRAGAGARHGCAPHRGHRCARHGKGRARPPPSRSGSPPAPPPRCATSWAARCCT